MGSAVSVDGRNPKADGDQAFKQGDYAGAYISYTDAIRNIQQNFDSNNSKAFCNIREELGTLFCNRSAALINCNQFEKALSDALVAIQYRPSWSKPYYRAGLSSLHLKRKCDALDFLSKALAIEPLNKQILDKIQEVQKKDEQDNKEEGMEGQEDDIANDAHETSASMKNGYIYSWGIGMAGVLGHGTRSNRSIPMAIDSLRGIYFRDVACGATHTVAVCGSGEVYSWGSNSHFQCGLNLNLPQGLSTDAIERSQPPREVLRPTILPGLFGVRVLAVSCGAAHTVVLGDSGFAYTWGIGARGQLGHGTFKGSGIPTAIQELADAGIRIRAAACGLAHTVLLDFHSTCWSFGENAHGQLGQGHREDICSPLLVEGVVDVAHIACGGGHTVLVDIHGRCFTVGSGTCGQLGHGIDPENGFKPNDIMDFKPLDFHHKVAFAACGEEFTMIITRKKQVYAFGLGNVGQLGISGMTCSYTPVLVKGLNGLGVETIHCGQGQVFALTPEGQVYTWGLPGDAALVHNYAEIVEEPKLVATLRSKRIRQIKCGRKHVCVIIEGIYPEHCTYSGFPQRIAAGTLVKIIIQARDVMDMPCQLGGDMFRLNIHPSDATPSILVASRNSAATDQQPDIILSGHDNLNGTYEYACRPIHAGAYEVEILHSGINIINSPFYFTVEHGTVDPLNCDVWWGIYQPDKSKHELVARAGGIVSFTITLKDHYGNVCTNPKGVIEVDISHIETGSKACCRVAMTSYGIVGCASDIIKIPGSYSVCLHFLSSENGAHTRVPLQNITYVLSAVPGKVFHDSVTTVFQGQAVVGRPYQCHVQCVDEFNNFSDNKVLLQASLILQEFELSPYAHVCIHPENPLEPQKCEVQRSDVGKYVVTVESKIAGRALLVIELLGTPIRGSPFEIYISPGPADIIYSTCQVDGLLDGKIGNDSASTGSAMFRSFFLECRDSYGNLRTCGLDDVVARLHKEAQAEEEKCSSKLDDVQVENCENGRYLCTYYLYTSGRYLLDVTINGMKVMGSPFQIVCDDASAEEKIESFTDIDIEDKESKQECDEDNDEMKGGNKESLQEKNLNHNAARLEEGEKEEVNDPPGSAKQFLKTIKKRVGGGWAWLLVDERSGALVKKSGSFTEAKHLWNEMEQSRMVSKQDRLRNHRIESKEEMIKEFIVNTSIEEEKNECVAVKDKEAMEKRYRIIKELKEEELKRRSNISEGLTNSLVSVPMSKPFENVSTFESLPKKKDYGGGGDFRIIYDDPL